MSGQRVVVTAARTRRDRTVTDWPVVRELDEQTELGAVYVRSLMRAQLRVAMCTLFPVALVVVGLPAAFRWWPELNRVRILSMPLPWVVLVLLVQPVWVLVARWNMRSAEQAEQRFADMVARS